ncbi:MAG: hypothetical protein PHI12_08195 [Dehalococcoidales bacterium]|nr:hypothetical protein [Dehalococcoidales bacterium]
MVKLQPLDILVFELTSSPWDKIEKWALGNPYGHVGMYLGGQWTEFYEAAARGVLLTPIQNQFGRKCVVMRPDADFIGDKAEHILANARAIAGNYDAYYAWGDIAWFVLPKIILTKLNLPIPLKYHRDKFMICSEACAEVYWRAGLEVLPQDLVPMPADFIIAPGLTITWEGILGIESEV